MREGETPSAYAGDTRQKWRRWMGMQEGRRDAGADLIPGQLVAFPEKSERIPKEPELSSWDHPEKKGEVVLCSKGLHDVSQDSEGYVHIFKLDLSQANNFDQLFLPLWKVKAHELGVSKVMAVPMESFLFTLSYDQKLKAMDSVTGQVIFEELNQCNVVFHSLAWDSTSQDVIVADSKGNVGFYNLIQESWITWKNVCEEPILSVHLLPSKSRLLLLTPHSLQVWDILRGMKFQELKEHHAPVVSIASKSTSEGGILYTAAMDNTIRMWDSETLECIKCIKERKEEITAMVYLPRANVIITGHENSDLKMWSLDSEEAYLRTVTGQSVHENTISALIVVHVHGETSFRDTENATGFELVVAGSYDRRLSFWRVTLTSDGTAMAKLERFHQAHPDATDEILALGHSAFSGAIFSGGNEGVIRQWSLWGSTPEAEFRGHEDAITCFAADAHFLFSGHLSAEATGRRPDGLTWYVSVVFRGKIHLSYMNHPL
ncbi:unnamed protein product [Durusdinium trenchii]|uniref:Uncharacterized protein n=1 Tax=Durusdinium trenchii TaxID=1381693 RepID=A0ABP0SEM7_9DINO